MMVKRNKETCDIKVSLAEQPGGIWKDALKRFSRNRIAILCLAIFLFICLSCALAPLLTKYDYSSIDASNRLLKPSPTHLLGTDNLGRDLLTRILYGGRMTLRITFTSTVIALLFGSVIGLAAGYFGGKADFIISPVLDILAAIPVILLALVFEAMLSWGNGNFMYAIAIAAIPQFARLVRVSVINIMGSEYIEASRALGVGHLGVIFRHILHNVAPALIVRFTSALAEAMLTCTVLGYLSIGINPPTPEWGNIVYLSKNFIRLAPQLMIIPCVVISLTVISISLVGDGLRDAMDPRGELAKRRSLWARVFTSLSKKRKTLIEK
jgi:ABC-type dipeptide/oligopeptide/nickel transport system permease subunit